MFDQQGLTAKGLLWLLPALLPLWLYAMRYLWRTRDEIHKREDGDW